MLSSPICIDASYVLRLLESDSRDAPAVKHWGAWHASGRPLVAPTLLYYEVSNAIRRYVVHDMLTSQDATDLLDVALKLDIVLYGDEELHRRALRIAEQFSLPAAYDSHYLALAERLGTEFWTADRRLVQKVGDSLLWIHLLPS